MEEELKRRLIDPIWDTFSQFGELYYFGINLQDYIESGAMFRLQHWLGFGLCPEMSVLSMIGLQHNNTARLCQGTYVSAEGVKSGFHCWVEFRIEEQEYAADLVWNEAGITWIAPYVGAYEACYYRVAEDELLLNDGGKLLVDWSINYVEFWEYELAKQLREEMKDPKTSNIFEELTFFQAPQAQKGFLIPKDLRSTQNGKFMVPHYRSDMPLAAVIFKYFFNHPESSAPSAQVIRKVEHAISVFNQYALRKGFSEI